jgi:hypothetical protein
MAKKIEEGSENPNEENLDNQGQNVNSENTETGEETGASGGDTNNPTTTPPPTIKPTFISGVMQDSSLVEEGKSFVFNQTGNIMVSTTQDPSVPLSGDVMDVFNEVSVFFAAMTKAITNTPNPKNNNEPYSIFNCDALEKIIDGSGCFVEVTKEEVTYQSHSFGLSFSRDLLIALLGLPGGGAMTFASSMVASVGQEGLRISSSETEKSSKVGSMIFICEYLMGMPIVTVVYLYTDTETVSRTVRVGPCAKATSTSVTMNINKDVYYFVTPALIKKYAKDLDTLIGNAEYGEFISYLESVLKGGCFVEGIYDGSNKITNSTVTVGKTYIIKGAGFGITGSLTLGEDNAKKELSWSEWNDSSIEFAVPSTAVAGKQELKIIQEDGATILVTLQINIEQKSN